MTTILLFTLLPGCNFLFVDSTFFEEVLLYVPVRHEGNKCIAVKLFIQPVKHWNWQVSPKVATWSAPLWRWSIVFDATDL